MMNSKQPLNLYTSIKKSNLRHFYLPFIVIFGKFFMWMAKSWDTALSLMYSCTLKLDRLFVIFTSDLRSDHSYISQSRKI